MLKLLFLTDLHFETDTASLEDAVSLVKEKRPNVLILGGDYESLDKLLEFLQHVDGYVDEAVGILGNNDEYDFTDIEKRAVKLTEEGRIRCSIYRSPHGGHVMLHFGHTEAVFMDNGVYYPVSDGEKLVEIYVISRNIGVARRKHRKTMEEYAGLAESLANMKRLRKYRILVIHEVPLTLCQLIKQEKPDFQFFEPIAWLVEDTVRKIKPDMLLHGHLHMKPYSIYRIDNTLCVHAVWTRQRAKDMWDTARAYAEIVVSAENLSVRVIYGGEIVAELSLPEKKL